MRCSSRACAPRLGLGARGARAIFELVVLSVGSCWYNETEPPGDEAGRLLTITA